MTPAQVSSLGAYANLLAAYELANVIGTRDPAKVLLDHIVDSLSCFLTGRIAPGKRIIDVGSGGGLPGIPLLLACPGLLLALLEATAKKVRFLESVLQELDLGGVTTLNQRAEDVGRDENYRDSFDIAVTRAVAALPVVVEYCAPLVQPGGCVIAMKGRLTREEVLAGHEAAKALGAELEAVKEVTFLPDMVQKERRLVVFHKTAATPEQFPRRVGLARQKPLGHAGRN